MAVALVATGTYVAVRPLNPPADGVKASQAVPPAFNRTDCPAVTVTAAKTFAEVAANMLKAAIVSGIVNVDQVKVLVPLPLSSLPAVTVAVCPSNVWDVGVLAFESLASSPTQNVFAVDPNEPACKIPPVPVIIGKLAVTPM